MFADFAGTWVDQNGLHATITVGDGMIRVQFSDADRGSFTGTEVNGSTIKVQLTDVSELVQGTLQDDGRRIVWQNGTVWIRVLPIARFSLSPSKESIVEGRGVRFEWDLSDFQTGSPLSRLVIKEQLVGQSAEAAMNVNEVRFSTLIEHLSFYILSTDDLKNLFGKYVWQVVGLIDRNGNDPIATVAGEVGTFRLARGRVDIGGLTSDTNEAVPSEVQTRKDRVAPLLTGGCPNGDLETGTFTGWQAYYGSRLNSSTVSLNNMQSGFINGRHTIRALSDGDDPFLTGLLPQVGEGSYSARLGNSSLNGEAEVLAYTFTVNQQNKNFSFRFAVVLQDPGHTPSEQPFFQYYILQGSSIFFSSSNLPIAARQLVADSSNPYFKKQGSIVYRDWTPTCVDLSAYLNHVMTIVFVTADCAQGGHFGYAYIDGLCRNNDAVASFTMPAEICASGVLLADGSASTNETSFFWSIEESDVNGGRNPATEVYEWTIAQQAGSINLTAWYAGKGRQFKCNTYYRVKLAVSNECTTWNETVQILHIKCPPVTAGPDLCVSCRKNGVLTQLGVGNKPGQGWTYAWSPASGLDNPAIPAPFHAQGSVAYPMTYTVTVTDPTGCSNSDDVTLYCEPPKVEISMARSCCAVTLSALTDGSFQRIVWSKGNPSITIQSGVVSVVVSSPDTYTVTVKNACGTTSKSIQVPAANGLSGVFNPIAANSRFSPPSGATNIPDKLYIKDVIVGGGIAGAPGAYNATEYKLEIFDRWGSLFRTIPGQSCSGFANWSLAWDGRDGSGQIVQQDSYVWMVHFKNCQYKEWTAPKMRQLAPRYCVKWFKVFGIKLWCTQHNVANGATVDVPLTPQSVVVVI